MNSKSFEAAIEKGMPGTIATAEIKGEVVYLTIANAKGQRKDLANQAMKALSTFGLLESTKAINFRFSEIPDFWKKDRIRTLVDSAIRSVVSRTGMYHMDVDVGIQRDTVEISVCSPPLSQSKITDSAFSRIEELRPEILRVSGCTRIDISLSSGRSSLYPHQHGPCTDEDDGEEDNPNWPSKTGRPSGGGRGNNPPGSNR